MSDKEFENRVDQSFEDIDKEGAWTFFNNIRDALNYLELSYEQFISNRSQTVSMYSDTYYTYHYFAYTNFFYSLKERVAQFINQYLHLGDPIDNVGYYGMSQNTEAKKVFQVLFDFFNLPVFKPIVKDRISMSHHSTVYSSHLTAKDILEKDTSAVADLPKIDKSRLDEPHRQIKSLFVVILKCVYKRIRPTLPDNAFIDGVINGGGKKKESVDMKNVEVKK